MFKGKVVKDSDKFSVSALGSLQDDRVSSLEESPIVSVWRSILWVFHLSRETSSYFPLGCCKLGCLQDSSVSKL